MVFWILRTESKPLVENKKENKNGNKNKKMDKIP